MLHTLGEQRGDAASAGYGRTGGKSSSRCKCSWPRMNTTPPHGDRAGPGAGREARDVLHGRVPDAPSPSVPGHPVWVSRGGHRSASCRCSRFWIFLCRKWWNSCRMSCVSSTRFFLFPSRLSKCPRSCSMTSLCAPPMRDTQLVEQLVEVPTIISYSSLRRTTEQHVDIPVPRRGGRQPGLQGLLAGQSSTASQLALDRISERIAEQNVHFAVSRGGIQDSRPGQGSSSSSHVPARDQEGLDEPGEGFFRTFHQNKKVRSWVRSRVRECPLVSAHPRRLLSTVFVSSSGS